jgi:hypothetical protein
VAVKAPINLVGHPPGVRLLHLRGAPSEPIQILEKRSFEPPFSLPDLSSPCAHDWGWVGVTGLRTQGLRGPPRPLHSL